MLQLTLNEVCTGLLLGTAFGDAFGIPYENLTYEELRATRNAWKVTAGLKVSDVSSAETSEAVWSRSRPDERQKLQPLDYTKCFGHPFIDCEAFPAGMWTDDTQLTAAVCRTMYPATALTSHGLPVLNWAALAREHVAEWRRSLNGWGGTRTAVERLSAAADASKPEVEMEPFSAHRTSGNATAVGNGVLMKMTPLGLLAAVDESIARSRCMDFGKQDRCVRRAAQAAEVCRTTHGSIEAVLTAGCHLEMLVTLFCHWPLPSQKGDAWRKHTELKPHRRCRAAIHQAITAGMLFCTEITGEALRAAAKRKFPDEPNPPSAVFMKALGYVLDDYDSVFKVADHLRSKLSDLLTFFERRIFPGMIKPSTESKSREIQPDLCHPAAEETEVEQFLVEISEGMTFNCVSSTIAVWGYLLFFLPGAVKEWQHRLQDETQAVSQGDVNDATFPFPRIVAHCAMLGGDADSTAAIVGGVIGCMFGAEAFRCCPRPTGPSDFLIEAATKLELRIKAQTAENTALKFLLQCAAGASLAVAFARTKVVGRSVIVGSICVYGLCLIRQFQLQRAASEELEIYSPRKGGGTAFSR